MTSQEKRRFERIFLESFENDISVRELRLSDEELQHLGEFIPRAEIREMPVPVCSDGKKWYEVSLRQQSQK